MSGNSKCPNCGNYSYGVDDYDMSLNGLVDQKTCDNCGYGK